jgi:hypothetical protein
VIPESGPILPPSGSKIISGPHEHPLWSILIPTIPQREAWLRRLLGVLLPQVEPLGGAVEVLAWRNAGERSLGEIRDGLMSNAAGRYVSFIDDDDLVAEFYVAEIMRAVIEHLGRTGQWPDHVGFQLEYWAAGELAEVCDHSLRHGRWHRNSEMRLVRDFTHLDPILRDKALRGRFAQARRRRAEDRVWCKQVRPFLFTEAYVDKVLYQYLWNESTSSWQHPERILPAGTSLPAIDHPFFRWHPESL